MVKSLLLELGTEELPARFVVPAIEQLEQAVTEGLTSARIQYADVRRYATPRRLAVLVEGVAESQQDLEQERKGPSRQIAFDAEGNPTKAALGFARGAGVAPEDLVVRDTGQGEYVFAVIRQKGRPTIEVLPEILEAAILKLSFPKSMRWGSGDMRFARPLRWITALFGDEIVSFTVAGIQSGRTTRGHRVLAQKTLEVAAAHLYPEVMEAGFVIADLQRRKEMIRTQVVEAARSMGGQAVIDPDLLDEVTCLVEYPTALCGHLDPAFLTLPEEVLITSMQEHQKYFPVRGADGKLAPLFVTVRNGGRHHLETVRKGNEKVLSARLSDAKFFYEEDRKTPLANKVEALKTVVFQEQLGTVYQKTERIRQVAAVLADTLGWSDAAGVIDRTALLCKADLVTHMVYEFPELQGIMGREYARLSGEANEVAEGIFEHYLPRYAGDRLAESRPGIAVGVADKIDTIVGCFAIGLVPTGSQDPYGLRRRTLGIIQTILGRKLPVRIDTLIDASIKAYGSLVPSAQETAAAVHDFFDQRLRGVLDEQGFRYDLVDAVLAVERNDLNDVVARLEALQQGVSEEYFSKLLTGFQRAANLVDKQGVRRLDISEDQLAEPAEKWLFEACTAREKEISLLLGARRYQAVMEMLAGLQEPIDRFFDDVMVMVDDEELRNTRLALLYRVVSLMTRLADLRKIAE